MPSSTFSSEPRAIPGGEWGHVWLFAVALAVALLAIVERFARNHGDRPSVVDDPVSWATARVRVDDDPRAVAFVGSSRMELAYSARAFTDAAPGLHGTQLAINAVPSLLVLEDLAADEHFRGVAVVDLIEWDISFGDPYSTAKPYIDRAHARWRAPGAYLNRWLATRAQERLAVLAVGGRALLGGIVRATWPAPRWVVDDRDRIAHADYSLAPPAELARKAKERLANFNSVPTPDAWLEEARQLEPFVRQIRAHGGEVVFVRPPTSGRLAAAFEEHYPRALYWNRFVASTTAAVIDARDVPAMARLTCPDEIHLDGPDQYAFTRSLVEELRQRGVLRGRE